jgi:hypothetical protein
MGWERMDENREGKGAVDDGWKVRSGWTGESSPR